MNSQLHLPIRSEYQVQSFYWTTFNSLIKTESQVSETVCQRILNMSEQQQKRTVSFVSCSGFPDVLWMLDDGVCYRFGNMNRRRQYDTQPNIHTQSCTFFGSCRTRTVPTLVWIPKQGSLALYSVWMDNSSVYLSVYYSVYTLQCTTKRIRRALLDQVKIKL